LKGARRVNAFHPTATPVVSPGVRVLPTKVFVRALEVPAEVGVYDNEYGRRQPLIVDVEMVVDASGFEHIADTINYETVRDHAQALAGAGHWKLVETFAERLGLGLMEDPRIRSVRVRVEKPEALKPDAAAAGVEIALERG
jgi:dihydroneopterin aldolase